MFYDATETEKQAFKLNSPATSTHVEQHKNHVNRRSAQWQVDGNLPGVDSQCGISSVRTCIVSFSPDSTSVSAFGTGATSGGVSMLKSWR